MTRITDRQVRVETIPTETECLELLEKYNTPIHIIAHSKRVRDVAKILAEGLLRRDHGISMDLLCASCLLHDIGKYPCIIEGGGYHDIRGEQILTGEGFGLVAGIVVQHVILRGSKEDPIAEEHVLFYADKRVVHDEVVSLNDRFLYLEETYGKNEEAIRRLNIMKQETQRLENVIFELLDFTPVDIYDMLP
jgi:hypothetical protein